jgi:hypothetical protein
MTPFARRLVFAAPLLAALGFAAVAAADTAPPPAVAPAVTTTTATALPVTAPAPAVEPELVAATMTVPTTAPVAASTTTTTTWPLAIPGHYTCSGADNDSAECVHDEDGSEAGPASPAGDQPGQTLGSANPGYGAWLTAQICADKPWTCQ